MPNAVANARYYRTRRHQLSRARNVAHYLVVGSSAARGRELSGFTGWGENLSAGDVIARVESIHQHNELVYTVVLSPAPGHERYSSEQWRQLTTDALEVLSDNGNWVAVVHDDPDHPHVHVVIGMNQQLNLDELLALNEAVDRSAEWVHGLNEIDSWLTVVRERSLTHQLHAERELDWGP